MTPQEQVGPSPEAMDAIREGLQAAETWDLEERLARVEERLVVLETVLDIIAGHVQIWRKGRALTPPGENGGS